MTKQPDGPWYYQQLELGLNYRMTDLHAALGLSQSKRLDHYVSQRHAIAKIYDRAFREMPVQVPHQIKEAFSAFHLYVIRLNLDKITLAHQEVFKFLRNRNIGVNLHYIPVHLQPYFQKMGFKLGQFPNAEQYYREAISLPIFPTMSDSQQRNVIHALREVL